MSNPCRVYVAMRRIIFISFCLIAYYVCAQTNSIDDILSDIYGQLAEEMELPFEDLQEELTEIAAHPINLNQARVEDLQRLRFLNDEQIDAILLYQYRHPFQSVYELQLIPELRDYDIRNMLPFVKVEEVNSKNPMYLREVFHYAKHELSLRLDARNCESFTTDPIYGKLRYRFNFRNRVQAGVTIGRPTGVPWRQMQYGAYVQLRDIGHIKSLAAGDYQAYFGQGLVVGTPFHLGKTTFLSSSVNGAEGVRKFSSVGDNYNAFHGVGTTMRIQWADISAFYSLDRQKDSTFHHLLGANFTAHWRQLKVGITAIENLYASTSELAPQVVMGVNVRYNFHLVDIWGEVAVSQGRKWGAASIVGMRFTPLSNVNIMAVYRYYSLYYDNKYAYSFSEKSRLNDENGFYLGADIRRLRHWRFAVYADGFRDGYDGLLQADFTPKSEYGMTWRYRMRRQQQRDTYSLRYRFNYTLSQWCFHTQADANLVQGGTAAKPTYGISLLQDVEYRFTRAPIVLQIRLQGFDARSWNNRIYAYENDVLYAFSFPNAYGIGGRCYLNARYRVNDYLSVYLRVSETVYQRTWSLEHYRAQTRTDVHLLLRATFP